MIAQVITFSASVPITDETRKYVEEVSAEALKADGLEGTLNLADLTTGEGLVITLYRDQAAMDVFQAERQRLSTQAQQDLGVTVSEPRVYEVLVRL